MKSLLVASFIAGVATVTSTFAGTKDGGGGPSVICNGPDGKVQSAQLLDLHEAQVRYGLTVPHSNAPAQDQLKAAFQRLAGYNGFVASDVEDALVDVESRITFLPAGEIMAPGVDLGDGYAAIIPNGCSLAYVGYYESNGILRISKDIFDLLSETDRAALLMHEALYKVARDIGYQKDSLVSRKFNGYLFSTVQDLSALDGDAADLSYASRFMNTGESSNIHFFPPVTVQGAPQRTLTIKLSGPADSVISTIDLQCLDSEGNAPVIKVPPFDATGSTQADIGTCRAFHLAWGQRPPFTVTYKYGDQVIGQEAARPDNSGYYELNSFLSVYFPHDLELPIGPNF